MQNTKPAPSRGTLSVRSGSSRQLLQRKQMDSAAQADPVGEALEDSFPGAEAASNLVPAGKPLPSPTQPESAPPSPATPAAPASPPAATAWSSEDESAFQAMTARRKAAGFRRRGKDVAGQLVCVGDITPNAGTVMAAIVAIVAERGAVARGELVGLMPKAAWPDPKTAARAADRSWCAGYISGALRDGWLALANGTAAGSEASA